MEKKDLTNEWIPYDGDYCKEFQDIRLKDGTEIMFCYPNAGFFHPMEKSQSSVSFPEKLVTHVRKTSEEYKTEAYERWKKNNEVVVVGRNEKRIDLGYREPECSKGHAYRSLGIKKHKEVWQCKNCGKLL